MVCGGAGGLLLLLFLAVGVVGEPEVVLVTGGYTTTGELASTEVLGSACSPPPLPSPSACHTSLLSTAGVLTCGGSGGAGCHLLEPGDGWSRHSTLDSSRYYAASVALPEGSLILGGTTAGSGNSSTLLPPGSAEWGAGPGLPLRLFDGCSVAAPGGQVVVVGAYYSRHQVWSLHLATSTWVAWPDLLHPRVGHACHLLSDNIVIAGGFGEDRRATARTTLLNILTREAREVGGMTSARGYFGLALLGQVLVAFGGTSNDTALRSTEEWDEVAEEWVAREEELEEARYYFGYTRAPASAVCSP